MRRTAGEVSLRELSKKLRPRPCAKFMLALFGSMFLIALLNVPVTTTTSSLRSDPKSLVVFRTTHPRKAHLFLPQYLSQKAHPREGTTVRARTSQWVGFMAIVALLGLFDYGVFCRLLMKPHRRAEGGADAGEDPGPGEDSSGPLSLFP